MTTPFGIGRARFHLGEAGPAGTVYLGIFRREVIERLGGYDEHFARAQDWELNHRIRAAGETVWFTPDLEVTYRPRGSLGALGKQFFRSGEWRREVLRRYPGTASLRYLATRWRPLRSPSVPRRVSGRCWAARLGSRLADPVGLRWRCARRWTGGWPGLPWRSRLWLPVVLATMHMTWGTGFLVGHRHAADDHSDLVATAEWS